MHSITIQRAIKKENAPTSTKLRQWASAALQHAKASTEITIRLVDRIEMTSLNETYRYKKGPTNVLSFPMQLPNGILFKNMPLGDIIICAEIVNQEADEQSKSPDAHWAHMVIHGVFHLMGHDHENESEAAAMEALEIDTLAKLGFSNPYEERD